MAPGPPPSASNTGRELGFLELVNRLHFPPEDSEPSIVEDGDDEVKTLEEENKRLKSFIKDIIKDHFFGNYFKSKLEELGIDLSEEPEVKKENKKEDNYIENRLRNIE